MNPELDIEICETMIYFSKFEKQGLKADNTKSQSNIKMANWKWFIAKSNFLLITWVKLFSQ